MKPEELKRYLDRRRLRVDRALARFLPRGKDWPPELGRAMEYSLMAGGKRLRPILALAAAEACGGDARRAMTAACALEFIHTYSLIHDDLPAMDDDDFRRGRPTSHKVFGDALAILAGDALLTRAFEILAEGGRMEDRTRLAVIREIALAAGGAGMVGGQVEDIRAEGRKLTTAAVRSIHRRKTGALITAAVAVGALTAGAGHGELARLSRYGMSLGALFQVVDDILDEEGELARMGKTPGSDRRRGKATLPAVAGLPRSHREAARLAGEARKALAGFGPRGKVLEGLIGYILMRKS